MKDIRSTQTWKNLLRRGVVSATLAAVVGSAVVAAPSVEAVNLTGAGATFPFPLYSKWFNDYRRATGVTINYQAIGSGGGINALKSRTVDFGASDAPLTNAELAGMPGSVVQIPTVAGAVAVVYNGLPRGLRLTGPVLADIYLGQITRWNDARIAALNPGVRLPSRPISVVRRSDGSGTTFIFTSYLKSVSPTWARQVGAAKSVSWPVGQGERGNPGVAAAVKQQAGSIGYVELAFAEQQNMPYASLRNRSGQFVLPGVDSVTAAASASSRALQRDVRSPIVNASGARVYPISGFTYLLIYRNQTDKAKGRELVRFLNWSMTTGQRSARSLLYAPLPQSIRRLNAAKIRSIR